MRFTACIACIGVLAVLFLALAGQGMAYLDAVEVHPLWFTYLGGSADDNGTAVTSDHEGNIYLVGSTDSTDFPTPSGYDQDHNGSYDVCLAKFDRDGTLLWATYLGGSDRDHSKGLATDESGSAFVTGRTRSTDFPSPGGYDPTHDGGLYDAFLAKFSADGELLWSTYLGGVGWDEGHGTATDREGNVYVTGWTLSPGLPMPGGYDPTHNGNLDAFLSKFSGNGVPLWTTFLGADRCEEGHDVEVDAIGNVYVTGETDSPRFPVPEGFDQGHNGKDDAFLAKFSQDGVLLWSTFLGGSDREEGVGLAASETEAVYVTGITSSIDFPTPGGYDTVYRGNCDAFVSKFNSDGGLLWSTYLGGGGRDEGRHVTADGMQNIYVVGDTSSDGFPTRNGWDPNYNGSRDGFVAKFSTSGGLLWSTYLGGSESDGAFDVVVESSGNFYVGGGTNSAKFPAPKGHDPTYNGGPGDAFLVKFIPGVPTDTPTDTVTPTYTPTDTATDTPTWDPRTPTATPTLTLPQWYKCDLDRDGDADLFDVLRMVDIVLDIPPPPNPWEAWAADWDDDGDFDLFDLLGHLSWVCFPLE